MHGVIAAVPSVPGLQQLLIQAAVEAHDLALRHVGCVGVQEVAVAVAPCECLEGGGVCAGSL